MSTKIYNGYAMDTPCLAKLFEFCSAMRERAQSAVADAWRSGFSAEDFRKNWGEINDIVANAERQGLRHPLDFKAEAVFLPGNNQLLAITFWEKHKTFYPIWHTTSSEYFPRFRQYPYWNNSGRPSGVTKKEWERREAEWNTACPGAPSDRGLLFTFASGRVPFPHELFPGKP